jgi:hypothetical protein
MESRPSEIRIRLVAEGEINDRILLPVDILAVDETLAAQVLEIGAGDWFVHKTRDRLAGDEIYRFDISGGDRKEVTVPLRKPVLRIIIFADYDRTTEGRTRQIVLPRDKWKSEYTVRVRQMELELEP